MKPSGPLHCAPTDDLEVIASRRHLDCVHVSRCCGIAARSGWLAFKCGAGCFVRISSERRLLDVEGLAQLVGAALSPAQTPRRRLPARRRDDLVGGRHHERPHAGHLGEKFGDVHRVLTSTRIAPRPRW